MAKLVQCGERWGWGAWIPGTRSDWAAGSISKDRTSLGAIFRHSG